jgi:hypothetical protein
MFTHPNRVRHLHRRVTLGFVRVGTLASTNQGRLACFSFEDTYLGERRPPSDSSDSLCTQICLRNSLCTGRGRPHWAGDLAERSVAVPTLKGLSPTKQTTPWFSNSSISLSPRTCWDQAQDHHPFRRGRGIGAVQFTGGVGGDREPTQPLPKFHEIDLIFVFMLKLPTVQNHSLDAITTTAKLQRLAKQQEENETKASTRYERLALPLQSHPLAQTSSPARPLPSPTPCTPSSPYPYLYFCC